jgi:hypothetical protein
MKALGTGFAARGLCRRIRAMFLVVGVFVLAGAWAAEARAQEYPFTLIDPGHVRWSVELPRSAWDTDHA